jgi:2,3-bisphosphoglycerate-dependent phosphoglycerate mutase
LKYKNIPVEQLPASECLKDVVQRVVPFFEANIAPELINDKNILITAHGNSLRALVMYLEKLSPPQISEFNIPTGVPRKYEFSAISKSALEIVKVEFLGDPIEIANATQAVANQAKTEN